MSWTNAVCAAGLLAGMMGSSAHAVMTTLAANLDGLQEVPPNASPAFGMGDVTLNSATNIVTVTLGTYQDLLGNSTAVTINDAAVGANGPIILTLLLDTPGAASGTFSGTGPITPAQAADMLAGNTYINLRSNVFPSGEIRGQLLAVPEPASAGLLIGSAGLLLRRKRAR